MDPIRWLKSGAKPSLSFLAQLQLALAGLCVIVGALLLIYTLAFSHYNDAYVYAQTIWLAVSALVFGFLPVPLLLCSAITSYLAARNDREAMNATFASAGEKRE